MGSEFLDGLGLKKRIRMAHESLRESIQAVDAHIDSLDPEIVAWLVDDVG